LKTVNTPASYLEALNAGETAQVSGLCGRLIRGKKPEDFETLSDDSTRRVVIPVDSKGLQDLLGKSGYEMLITVGYDIPSIAQKVVDEGCQFKLVVFPEGTDALLGTWENVVQVVTIAYSDFPEVGQRMTRHFSELAQNFSHQTFDAFESRVGFDCSEVDAEGSTDVRYMTVDRYLQSDDSADNARLFLYFSVHLRELFAGDGWTRLNDGQKGVQEFLIPNGQISNLGGAQMSDIDVQFPHTNKNQNTTNIMSNIVQITDHMQLDFTPKYWDPAKAYQYGWKADVDGAYREGVEFAQQNGLKTAQKLISDGVANAKMLVDLQEDFRPEGRLPVMGTDDVILRVCARIINGTVNDYFSGLFCSQDGHPQNHISFNYRWRNAQGTPLDLPVSCLTLDDEKNAVFRVYNPADPDKTIEQVQSRFDPMDTVDYWKHLQKTGQGDIWAFSPHCLLRTDGVNMHPLLLETISFWSGARSAEPTIVSKGHLNDTDWFGAFEPCRPNPAHSQGGLQKEILDGMKLFEIMEFDGVAEDFCVFFSEVQSVNYFDGTEFLGKLRFVSDGTAPIIPNQQHVIDFHAEAKSKGVKFIQSNTPFGQVSA